MKQRVVALYEVDNAVAQEDMRFTVLIRAGLGAGANEYLGLQVHCSPADKSTRALWGGGTD